MTFFIKDIGKQYVELRYGTASRSQSVATIYYNTPNKVEWKGKLYFVETPYSSYDEKYHIYELTEQPITVL